MNDMTIQKRHILSKGRFPFGALRFAPCLHSPLFLSSTEDTGASVEMTG